MRYLHIERAFEAAAASGVEGDYLEFGVYHGVSFAAAYSLGEKFQLANMRYFAFDSFQGLPSSELIFEKNRFSASRESFTTYIRESGVDMKRVNVVEGFYDESLTDCMKQRYGLTNASIVHVDCDLYVSATDVLRFIEPLVQPGTVLIFDDWDSFRHMLGTEALDQFGERRAFEEWKLKHRFEALYEFRQSKTFVMR